jgi:hypothetical protein
MKLHGGIGNLAAAFGGMAADLKDKQDKLSSCGRGLESIISERTAELAHEKANLEINAPLRSRGVLTPRGGRTSSPRQAAGRAKRIARCN